MKKIALSLPNGNSFGWGVCGANLRRELRFLGIDQQFEVINVGDGHAILPVVDYPLLHCVEGPHFYPMARGLYSNVRNVGLGFIEDMQAAKLYSANAKFYDKIACGSTWMRQQLETILYFSCSDILPVELSTVIQGVDCEMFHPVNWVPWAPVPPTFRVFCGGKAEYRKGTDVAIAAMARFMRLHEDVELYAAWGNHWPDTMQSLTASPHIQTRFKLPILSARTHLEMYYTGIENGIPPGRMYSLGLLEQPLMARYYQMCDVGFFPNRCEAGTNMVMCEVMACGLPVVATMATGHLDVLREDYCFPVAGETVEDTGWFEPSVESAVEQLEKAYEMRGERLVEMGAAAREAMLPVTWEKAARQLLMDLGI